MVSDFVEPINLKFLDHMFLFVDLVVVLDLLSQFVTRKSIKAKTVAQVLLKLLSISTGGAGNKTSPK